MTFDVVVALIVGWCISWVCQWFMRCMAWCWIDKLCNLLTIVACFVGVTVAVLWWVIWPCCSSAATVC